MRARDASGPPLDAAQAAAADTGAKAMIPFGRPFLDHVLHSLAEAGIGEVALILGPEHDDVRNYYRSLTPRRLSIGFLTQIEPLGTANALLSAQEWSAGEPFLVLNADNLYPVPVLNALSSAPAPALPGFEPGSLELPADRLGAFALVEHDAANCLTRIVEKPGRLLTDSPAAVISMNVWHFDARIFDACRDVPLSARGERELPEAVGLAASRGTCFLVLRARGPVIDLSSRSDIPVVARHLSGAAVDL
jgi:glucose-1-phosphate thymidylyltransferase